MAHRGEPKKGVLIAAKNPRDDRITLGNWAQYAMKYIGVPTHHNVWTENDSKRLSACMSAPIAGYRAGSVGFENDLTRVLNDAVLKEKFQEFFSTFYILVFVSCFIL